MNTQNPPRPRPQYAHTHPNKTPPRQEAIVARRAQCAAEASIQPLRQRIDSNRVLEEAIAIQQIPAPTFYEQERAAYIHKRFIKAGLDSVDLDNLSNVYGRLRGSDANLPGVLVAAHTDTVFDMDTLLTIQRQTGRVFGPGLGDNSMGVAALLALVDVLCEQRFPADIWFTANVCEEGMGNLNGIRAVQSRLGSRLGAAIIVEGMAYGHIYHGGIA